MTINEYQKLAQRTANTKLPSDKLENACLGLAGETGEVCDVLKKALFQGHALDREHMIEELGDCAWYLAEAASGLGVSLEDILLQNIAKLKRRYPAGFDPERSMHREAGACERLTRTRYSRPHMIWPVKACLYPVVRIMHMD